MAWDVYTPSGAELWGTAQDESKTGDWQNVPNMQGWQTGWAKPPMKAQPQYGNLPSYFTNLPTDMGAISPLGYAALMRLFQNVPMEGAPVQSYVKEPGEKASESVDESGKPVVTEATPAVKADTAWARPQLPSAQSYKRMEAGGALNPLEAYLDLQGEAIKQQYMQQARAAWAPQSQRTPAQWRIPKM